MKALVLNYGVGNLFSISSALKRVGFDVRISSDLEYDYDLLVLPGVGSFKALGPYIEKKGDLLKDVINKISAVLGICLGMQILFEYSTEYGYSKGLGILEGYVERI
ncbi:MAG: imidazole glycerol phosphate synthase subunit HisH, partial [Ignisphaera sp.]